MLPTTPPAKKAEVVLIGLIVALALIVRAGVTHLFQGFDAPPKAEANPDQVDYEAFAAQLASGHGYCLSPGQPSACRPPGTSFVLTPVYLAFGRSYLAARSWFCLLSAATVAATWWLARRAFGSWSGLMAALMLAVYPGHFYYAMHFLSEVPFALGVTVATALGVAAARAGGSWRTAVGAGVAWGCTILVRPSMQLGVLLVALALLLAPGTWKHRLSRSALVVVSAALVLVPWIARNALVMGKPTICTIVGGFTFWGAHNPIVANAPGLAGSWVPVNRLADASHPVEGDEARREKLAWSYGLAFIREHPDSLLRLELHKLMRLILPYRESENATVDWAFRIGWLAIAPFVAIGTTLALRGRAPEVILLLVPVLATIVTSAVFYGCNRFRDGIAPILVAFAGYGFVWAIGPLARRGRPARLRALIGEDPGLTRPGR